MIRTILFVALVGLGTAGLVVDTLSSTPALPFYDSADLTPHWSRSVEHRIADFDLITQTGARIRGQDLLGRAHVASFIYTHCAGVCPAMVSQLSKVQHAIAGRTGAVLVSFTVTPQQDTPETLAKFGDERRINHRVWKLVTGDAGQIYALARTSYFADDGRLDAATPVSEQFLHTEKALLVDKEGRLRGVYNATVPHDIEKLISDLEVLRGEP
jgi:protein SCO1/2